jgi:cell fate (sporulation/competence/biofilm development) regulator YmcA (YheA/YmcA/DUF963 family)
MIVKGTSQRHCKNIERDAALRNKEASSQIRHELELSKKSSEIVQLGCRAVALKKFEKANQITSHFEASNMDAIIKDLHPVEFNLTHGLLCY